MIRASGANAKPDPSVSWQRTYAPGTCLTNRPTPIRGSAQPRSWKHQPWLLRFLVLSGKCGTASDAGATLPGMIYVSTRNEKGSRRKAGEMTTASTTACPIETKTRQTCRSLTNRGQRLVLTLGATFPDAGSPSKHVSPASGVHFGQFTRDSRLKVSRSRMPLTLLTPEVRVCVAAQPKIAPV